MVAVNNDFCHYSNNVFSMSMLYGMSSLAICWFGHFENKFIFDVYICKA